MKDKILQGFLADFQEQFGLAGVAETDLFGYMATHVVLSRFAPESVDLIDASVDGGQDTGIDAIAILVNGHVVNTPEEIDFFRDKLGRLEVQFIFVQTKTAAAFKASEIGSFLFGVRDFFDDTSTTPANDRILSCRELREYLYKLSVHMAVAPICRAFYVTTGEWKGDPTVAARIEGERQLLLDTELFSEVTVEPYDAARLKQHYRSLRHKIEREVLFEKHTILPQMGGVTEAYLGILPADQYLALITDSDGELQPGLFYDNVRDFQGNNAVNTEIAATLQNTEDADHFVLLNNGITIVARSITKIGAKFRISDYQIVNGCQTSHVMYMHRNSLGDGIYLPVKLIATDDAHVTNHVIRATNRQTAVLPEAFESLSPFHRLLEEFYAAMGRENGRRLYYERRSKQYASLPIKASDIVTLPVQAKAFLGTFLEEPHSTHRYYGEILSTNRSRIFREGHSAYPYYVAAYGWKRMQQALARGEVERRYKPYLFHLLLLIRKASGGDKVPALSGKDIDEYCKKVFAVLSDDGRFGEAVANAQATLDRAIGSFIGDRRLMPRLRAFTASLVPAMRERPRGKVAYYNIDRGFGFVQLLGDGKAHDVFVHHSDLSGMDRLTHRYLEKGETVELDVVDTDRGPQGRDVRLIDTEQAAEPSVSSR